VHKQWIEIYLYLLMLYEHARWCTEDAPLHSQSSGWAVSTNPCRTRACWRWSQAVKPISFCYITSQVLFSCCQDVIVCCDSLSTCMHLDISHSTPSPPSQNKCPKFCWKHLKPISLITLWKHKFKRVQILYHQNEWRTLHVFIAI